MRFLILLLMALPLPAYAAQTISEKEGTFVYNGKTLRAVTREFQRRNGSTYSRRSISLGSRRVSCSATDDQDCIAAIRDSGSRRDR